MLLPYHLIIAAGVGVAVAAIIIGVFIVIIVVIVDVVTGDAVMVVFTISLLLVIPSQIVVISPVDITNRPLIILSDCFC